MSTTFPEPTDAASNRTEVMLRYLDYFRDQVASRVEGIPVDEQRVTRVPSGWTPVQLLKHLTHVEQRWLEWGFEGAVIAEPWADRRDGHWFVADTETLDDLLAAFRAQARRSNAVIESHGLDDVGQPGPRWEGHPPATLERVLLHLVQEYARHVGHLDIVAELAGGPTGE